MLAIVRLALRRPYTFVVMAILIVLFGPLAALRTPTDIFPDIRIPVIARGLDLSRPAARRHGRAGSSTITSGSSRPTVNDIEHIESQSLPGIGIVKIFFQPGVDIRTATAQVTSLSPDRAQADAARHHAAADPELQRLDRADPAAGAVRPDAVASRSSSTSARTSSARRWPRCRAPRCPRPTAARSARSRSTSIPQALQAKGLSAQDVGQRARRPEPDHPGRHRQDRRSSNTT